MTTSKNERGPAESEVPPKYPFAIGERVTGQGVTGGVVEQPELYNVTVQPAQGVRITLSVAQVERAKG